MSWLRNLFINLLLAGVVFLVMFLALEVYFRVFDYQPVEETVLDARLLWRHTPGYSGRFSSIIPSEYNTKYEINSKWLRDYEYNYSRNEKLRIMVLGDSFTEGIGVEMPETYPKLLEDMFGRGKVEIINGGIKGYGPMEEIVFYRDELSRYDPDIVIMSFFPGNDVVDMGRPRILNVTGGDRPVLVETGERHSTDLGFIMNLRRFVGMHSHVYMYTIQALFRNQAVRSRFIEWGLFVPAPRPFFTYPFEPYELSAVEATRYMEAFADELSASNKTFIVVAIPDMDQVYPGKFEAKLAYYNVTQYFDIFVANREIAELCRRKGLTCIDMTESFIAANSTIFYHNYDGHFNRAGQEFAAKLIYDRLAAYINQRIAEREMLHG